MLNGLDVFSGIGGIALALAPWVRPAAYCEIDRYAQSVLLSRMADGLLSTAPIWDDVKSLGSAPFDVPIDIITGGFPCQDISVAGTGRGLAGERSGLYWEIHRLVGELKPRYVFLENVPAITGRGGIAVVRSLAAMGYDCRWTVLSAAAVGAPHIRKRWWLLAHANGAGREEFDAPAQSEKPGYSSGCDASIWSSDWWATGAGIRRVADGVPHRVDRLRALGNAVVPLQTRTAFKILVGITGDLA